MKKFVILVAVVMVALIVVWRQRLFVRDPLGGVVRDGVKEAGAQVYINYSNDVLVENDNDPAYLLVVQHGQHVGTPVRLKCVHWMACLSEADMTPLVQTMDVTVNEMSSKLVEFTDKAGHVERVTLR